jgi:hypothetical protein
MNTSNILNESSIFPVWPEQSRADPKDPKQIEIEFFWPLTEQLKLDLDFTPCEKPKTYYYGVGSIGSVTYTTGTPNALHTTNFTNLTNTVELNLNLDRTNIVISGKPPLIRRWLYKLLGFKIKNGN